MSHNLPFEITKLLPRLSRSTVHVFVDGGDVSDSLDDLSESLGSPGKVVETITQFCRNLGFVKSSVVYDDTWNIPREVWELGRFHCVDIIKETNGESRVNSVLPLRVAENAFRTKGPAIFVLFLGGSNHYELVQFLSKHNIRTVVISVLEEPPPRLLQASDVWIPLATLMQGQHQVLDEQGFNWYPFIKTVHSLEDSNLGFVGVGYLMRDILPTIERPGAVATYEMFEKAKELNIIELYEEQNTKRGETYAVKACRLVRTNSLVREALDYLE